MDRLIRINELSQLIGLKKSAIYQRIQRGEFPRPVRLGGVTVWSLNEIQEWIEEQKRRRDQHGDTGGSSGDHKR